MNIHHLPINMIDHILSFLPDNERVPLKFASKTLMALFLRKVIKEHQSIVKQFEQTKKTPENLGLFNHQVIQIKNTAKQSMGLNCLNGGLTSQEISDMSRIIMTAQIVSEICSGMGFLYEESTLEHFKIGFY